MRLKADITLFIISIIWGSAFVAQRVAGQVGSVYIFNGVRYLLAALVVLPFAFRSFKNANSKLSNGQIKWMAVAGVFLFIASAFQQAGMVYTTAGNAGFITSLYVVLIPIILFTAASAEEVAKKGAETIDAIDYVVKPFDDAALLFLINRIADLTDQPKK